MEIQHSRGDAVRFMVRRWARDPFAFLLIALLIAAAGALPGSLPPPAAHTVDPAGPGGGGPGTVRAWATLGAAFLGAELLVFLLQNLLTFRLAHLKSDVLQEVLEVAGRASDQWHVSTMQGTTMRRAMDGADAVEFFTRLAFSTLLPILASIVGILVFAAFRWPFLAAFGAVATCLFWWIGIYLHDRFIEPVHTRLGMQTSQLGGALADSMTGAATVRSFAREESELARVGEVAVGWRATMITELKRWGLLTLAQSFTLFLYLVIAIGYMFAKWQSGKATAGDAMLGVTSYLLITGLLAGSMMLMFHLQGTTVRIRPLLDLLSAEGGIAERPDALALDRVGALPVSFEEVSFAYPGGERVIEDIALEIAAGEKVALIGATGSGKSTLVKLIQRLYDPGTGIVKVGGHDVRNLQIESLRRAVGIVPQDPVMFHRSVMENIAYGRPEATLEEVRAAAAMARADEFIMRMPEGYQSLVGERGVKLSGGERQRIAIARAFLADPPILVLDEATSSLDAITEKLIQEAVEQLLAQRTAIVIAHRLSTIRNVDRILVLDRGRILEQGSHQDLIEHSGKYAQLLQAQQMDG